MRDAPSLDSMTFHGPYVFPDFGVQRGNVAAKSQSTRLPTPLHFSDSTFFEAVLLHFLRHRPGERAATPSLAYLSDSPWQHHYSSPVMTSATAAILALLSPAASTAHVVVVYLIDVSNPIAPSSPYPPPLRVRKMDQHS